MADKNLRKRKAVPSVILRKPIDSDFLKSLLQEHGGAGNSLR